VKELLARSLVQTFPCLVSSNNSSNNSFLSRTGLVYRSRCGEMSSRRLSRREAQECQEEEEPWIEEGATTEPRTKAMHTR